MEERLELEKRLASCWVSTGKKRKRARVAAVEERIRVSSTSVGQRSVTGLRRNYLFLQIFFIRPSSRIASPFPSETAVSKDAPRFTIIRLVD